MKKLFTLVALLTCFMGAKAEKVYEVDYTSFTAFPYYVMGYVPEFDNGWMTDFGADYRYATQDVLDNGDSNGNGKLTDAESVVGTVMAGTTEYQKVTGAGPYWHQYFIATGIPTGVDGAYKVKALVKASAEVTIDVQMRWSWSADPANAKVKIPASEDFVEVEWEYSNIGGASSDLIAQPGGTTATIEWKSLAVYTADSKIVTSYGDLIDVTPVMYVKNYGGDVEVAEVNSDGEFVIEDKEGSGDAWATQFWINGEYPLPTGQKFYVEFDYKADNAGSVGTQTHNGNALTGNAYIIWHCIGDVPFKTEWDHFAQEVTIAADMNGWQAIAFNMHLNSDTKYYIKNIYLKEAEIIGEAVTCAVGKSGWTSFFNSEKDVALVDGVKAYGAVYNSETNKVDLTEYEAGEVPAGAAVLINAEPGGYSFDVIGGAAEIDNNDLEAYGIDQNSNGKYYALANGSEGIGFYPVKEGEVIPAGKAFLDLSDVINAPAFVPFNNGTTSISEKTIVKNNAEVVYNLAGQRVAQPTKGLYIVNGKKVIK